MTVCRVSGHTRVVEGQPASTVAIQYFLNRQRALYAGRRLARSYAAIHRCEMMRYDVAELGIVTVWKNRDADPDYEVRVEEGRVEDGA